jgi:hypothetical protein
MLKALLPIYAPPDGCAQLEEFIHNGAGPEVAQQPAASRLRTLLQAAFP